MALSIKWYRQAFVSAFKKEIDWINDDIKIALIDDTYVLDQDGDVAYSDISSYEVSGTGYTTGGTLLVNGDIDTPASKTMALSGENTSWPATEIEARFGVVYNDTPASKPLICLVDFGGNITSAGGDFRIIWNPSGIVDLVAE